MADEERTPATQLFTQFLKENDLVLVVSRTNPAEHVIKDHLYVVTQKPLVQVAYRDELPQEEDGQEDTAAN